MSAIGMDFRYAPKVRGRRYTGLIVVVVLHAFLLYAAITGLARKGLELIKKPLEAVVIQEVIIPPPPPPPPPKKIEPPKEAPKLEAPPPPFVPPPDVPVQSSTAPVITSVATPPPAPVAIAPPPPPVPAPAPKPVANRSDIRVACPSMVLPEMPRKALQDGTSGTVVAQILIRGGSVKEVNIISGPRIFHAAVRAAIMQYKCNDDGSGDVVATQSLEFKVAE